MPRVTRDAYTKYICVHHFLIGRGTLDRMPLNARSIGSARQTGHTPHGRTSATPSPQRMKILTRKYLPGRVAHERRGYYCFICSTTVPRRKPIQLPERAQRWYITSPPKKMLSTIYLCLAQSVVTPTQIPILLLSRPLHPTAPAKKKPSALCAMLVMNPYHTPKTRNRS